MTNPAIPNLVTVTDQLIYSPTQVLEQLREVASQRPTYGYRRLWVLLNRQRRREGLLPINAKRVYRLAKAHKLLSQRCHYE